MARRKSKARQEEELFKSLALMALFGGAAGAYSLTKSWKASLVVGFLGVVGVIVLMISIERKRAVRLKKSGIVQIDKMDGVQFEQYLDICFVLMDIKLRSHGLRVISELIWFSLRVVDGSSYRPNATVKMLV